MAPLLLWLLLLHNSSLSLFILIDHATYICLTHHLWSDLSDQIHAFLSAISLGDLIKKREIQEIADRQDKAAENKKQSSIALSDVL